MKKRKRCKSVKLSGSSETERISKRVILNDKGFPGCKK